MFNKVLVLADGGDPGQPALRRALGLVADGGEIEILAVVYEPLLEGYLGNKQIYEPLRQRVLSERRESAAALARAVESHGVRCAAKAVWSHPMHAAVAAEAHTAQSDLVVAAPANLHQRGGARRGGLTHGDWQVVTSCPVPLLLVKSDGEAPYRNVVAAVDPFHTHAKPAELDREILRHANAAADLVGAPLTVLHCYLPIDYFGVDFAQVPARDPRSLDARTKALQDLCAELGVPTSATRLVAGVPHSVLQAMQQRGEADLIVMGALARGRFAELILGNTAERVLYDGTSDVLLVSPARR
jgi:universal stress protein E